MWVKCWKCKGSGTTMTINKDGIQVILPCNGCNGLGLVEKSNIIFS